MRNYATPRDNETLGAGRNQLLGASDLIDADDSAIKEDLHSGIDCVRSPTIRCRLFHCDAHWANR